MTNSCPKCGGELPAGATLCVNCGASVNEKPEIDNSEEISRMLKAEKTEKPAAEKDSAQKDSESVVVDTEELNDKQIAAFESGSAIEFSNANGGLSEEAEQSIAAMDSMMFEDILPLDSELRDESVSYIPNDDDGIILKKGVTEMNRYRLTRANVISFVIVFVIAFGMGCGFFFLLTERLNSNFTNNTAIKSIEAIQPYLPRGYAFKAIDIYVKRGADVTECLVFGVVFIEANQYMQTYFRIIHTGENEKPDVFLPFDPEIYEALFYSADPLENMQAATMMGHYDSFMRSVAEINAGRPTWSQADIAFVNNKTLRK